MSYTDIIYATKGNAAIITINRPATLNALTYHTLAEIRRAVDIAVADTQVIGIIFTGEGRAFSSGLDASVLLEVTKAGAVPAHAAEVEEAAEAAEVEEGKLPGLFSYLMEVPKPVISAINGVAAGGGLILALMSDLRFAASSASLTTVFLKRGLIAEHGSSWILPRLVGVGRALDLLWASDKIPANEAMALGLVDKVFESNALVDEAIAYLDKLAATSAPLAIAETKRLIYNHLGTGYRTALIEAEAAQNRFVNADDAREGAVSFIEKRAPKFTRWGLSKAPGKVR